MTDRDEAENPEAGRLLLDHAMSTWVLPELDRRGLPRDQPVERGLILFPPKGKPRVILGDRADIIASCTSLRAIEAGELVTENDVVVNSIHPAREPRDHGWIPWAMIGDHIWVAFDLRRSRDTARGRVKRAEDFIETASEAAREGRLAVAIETGWAAAELVVMAEITMLGISGPRDHGAREQWWRDFTALGNGADAEADTFTWLRQQRSAARYGDARLKWSLETVTDHLGVVRGMVDRGLARTEHLRATQERRRAGDVDPRRVVGRTYLPPPPTTTAAGTVGESTAPD
jgi:HEPN domain-containing protein